VRAIVKHIHDQNGRGKKNGAYQSESRKPHARNFIESGSRLFETLGTNPTMQIHEGDKTTAGDILALGDLKERIEEIHTRSARRQTILTSYIRRLPQLKQKFLTEYNFISS